MRRRHRRKWLWAIPLAPPLLAAALFGDIPVGGGSAFTPEAAAAEGYCVPDKGTLSAEIPQPLNRIIMAAAKHWKADPYAVAVLFYSENGFTFKREPPPPYGKGAAWPVSDKNAGGPFQFIPGTWLVYKNSNPAHPAGDVNDLTDAAYAAAHYIFDLGAKEGAPLGSLDQAFVNGTITNAWRVYNSGYKDYLPDETHRYIVRGLAIYKTLAGSAPDGSSASAGCPNMSSTGWQSPLRNIVLTSAFGSRINPVTGAFEMHDGMDFSAPMGTPVLAPTAGKVTFSGWLGSAGNAVIITHEGYVSTFMHMSSLTVQNGVIVKPGEEIGKVGSTGQSTGPHLHFRLHRVDASGKETAVDPKRVLMEHGVKFPDAKV